MKSRFSIMLGLTLAGILTMQTAKADIVGNFEGLDFGSPSLPGNGQFNAPAGITADLSGISGSSPTGTITFNLTGLDVTGDASANDSASVTLGVSSATGNIQIVSGDQLGVSGNGAGTLSDASEVLTFSFSSGSVTFGDPGTGGAVNFLGFRNVGLGAFNAAAPDPLETAVISGGTNVDGNYDSPDQSAFDSANAFGNVSSFSVGAFNNTDRFSVARLGARIEFTGTAVTVPEPSSFALVSCASLGLLVRRRRNK